MSLDRQGAADQQAIVSSADGAGRVGSRSGEKPSERLAGRHRAREDRPLPARPTAACRSTARAGSRRCSRAWRSATAGGAIREGAHLIALEKDGASITLEPGGQLELSGAPLRTIHETCSEFQGHLSLMKRVCDPLGIVWLGLGINPIHGVGQIPQMPKQRYRIMRSYLPTRGTLALDMMYATATVQANFDYGSEADMVAKLRMALGVTPIVSAIFANSGLSEGKANGYVSRRLHIWQHTDPDRSGLLPFAFEDGFGYRDYVEWALDVPMFFVVRDGRYAAANGMTFRRFMTEGRDGERATLDDWARHLTTLFPEVRLKHVIEVRGADAVPPGLTCSLPALWKGLLYDAGARQAAWELVAASSARGARGGARGRGAAGSGGALCRARPVLELAKELAAISRRGAAPHRACRPPRSRRDELSRSGLRAARARREPGPGGARSLGRRVGALAGSLDRVRALLIASAAFLRSESLGGLRDGREVQGDVHPRRRGCRVLSRALSQGEEGGREPGCPADHPGRARDRVSGCAPRRRRRPSCRKPSACSPTSSI